MARIRIVRLAVGLFLCSVVLGSQAAEPEKREKVAEGTYHHVHPTTARNETEETWVLYRTDDGYIVESKAKRTSARNPDVYVDTSRYWLNKDMVLLRWEKDMPWAPFKKIGCEIAKRQLRCWDGWRGEHRERVSGQYEVYPFFVEATWHRLSLVHRSGAIRQSKPVRMIVIGWDIADGPDDLTQRQIEVRYLGSETVQTKAGEFEGQRFWIGPIDQKARESRREGSILVVSEQGLLLDVQSEHGDADTFSVVRMKRYAEFRPGR